MGECDEFAIAGVGEQLRMRCSRHARNEMRLYRLTEQDLAQAVENPIDRSFDEKGNIRLIGEAADGRRILAVVARDDPEFVITIFPRG